VSILRDGSRNTKQEQCLYSMTGKLCNVLVRDKGHPDTESSTNVISVTSTPRKMRQVFPEMDHTKGRLLDGNDLPIMYSFCTLCIMRFDAARNSSS